MRRRSLKGKLSASSFPKVLCRTALSLGLLAVLAKKVPWQSTWLAWKEAKVLWILAAEMLAGVQLLLGAWRWKVLLDAQRICVPLGSAVRITLIGQCFNSVLPGTNGGDVVRFLAVERAAGPKRMGLLFSLLYDRFLGAVALALCAPPVLLGFPWGSVPKALHKAMFAIIGAALLLGLGVLVMLFLAPPLASRGGSCGDPQRGLAQKPRFWGRLCVVLRRYRSSPRASLWGLCLSLLIQGSGLLLYGFLAKGFGIELSLLVIGSVMAVATLASCLPVSVGGLGVREGALLYLLAPLGVTPPAAIAFSLTGFVLFVAWGLVGALLLILPTGETGEVPPERAPEG
jgi:uncharacterized protein (TIRG00374 family)